jgi:hypothetical protein
MGGSASVCVLIKKLNNLMEINGSKQNFQDQSNPIQIILGRGSQINSLHSTDLGQKWSASRNFIPSLTFCPTVMRHTFLETSGLGLDGQPYFEF